MSKHNDQIAELLTDDSFVRWINGDANNLEQQKWDRWLEEDPANIAVVRQAKELNKLLRFEEEQPDTQKELEKLESALTEKQTLPNKEINRVGRGMAHWMRIAAAIALLITVIGVIRYAHWGPKEKQAIEQPVLMTAKTGYGEVRRLTFSDGSKIVLNANSTLTYPKTHQGGDMQVGLQGEAYFDIAHKAGQEQRLFSVRTTEGKVSVLGTRFNINTHSGGTKVVLEEGKVEVQKTHPKDSLNRASIMSPGELAMLSSNEGTINVQKVDTKLYTSWRNLELKFKNTPLHRIADRIEEIYGVEVRFSDKSLREIEFSGSAPNKNFAVLLEGLRTLLKIPINHDGNTITFGS